MDRKERDHPEDRLELLPPDPAHSELEDDAELRKRLEENPELAAEMRAKWQFDDRVARLISNIEPPKDFSQKVLARLEAEKPLIDRQMTRRRWIWTGSTVAASLLLAISAYFLWPRSQWTRQGIIREAVAWYGEQRGKWPMTLDEELPRRPVGVPGGMVLGNQTINFLGKYAEVYSLKSGNTYAMAIVVDRAYFSRADLSFPVDYADRLEVRFIPNDDEWKVCILVGSPLDPFLQARRALL